MLSHKVEDSPNLLSLFKILASICSHHFRLTFGKLVNSDKMERKIAKPDIGKMEMYRSKITYLKILKV